MTTGDWELSGVVMVRSDLTRAKVAAVLAQKAAAETEVRARRDGTRSDIAAETAAERAVQRVAKRLLGRLGEGPLAWSDARKAVAGRDREHFEEAIDCIVRSGAAAVEDTSRGKQIVLAKGGHNRGHVHPNIDKSREIEEK